MGHARWVVHFKVSSTNWQASLSHFAEEFLNLVHPDFPSEGRPILYTHSELLYPLRLINIHRNVPFRTIKFGSFFNSGQVGIHWNIEGGRRTQQDIRNGFNFFKEIDGSFEHDLGQITIFFNSKETDPADGKEYYGMYILTINMESIKKIGMDLVRSGGEIQRTLVLHVDYAPKIMFRLKNQVSNTGELTWGKFEHSLHIRRGKFPKEVSHLSALHESKLILFELYEEDLQQYLTPKSDSAIDCFIFDLLSRLRHKTGKAVEFTAYAQPDLIMGQCRDYDAPHLRQGAYEIVNKRPFGEDIDQKALDCIKRASERLAFGSDTSDLRKFQAPYKLPLKVFQLRVLIEAILQKGIGIRSRLLINRDYWHSFVELVCDRYATHEQKTLSTLENLLPTIAEGNPHCTVRDLFLREWEKNLTVQRSVFTEKKSGYLRVMKFIQTPTKFYFVGHETIMENRVLKQNLKNAGNGTEIIRVSFRDDSGDYMRGKRCGASIVEQTMRAVLLGQGKEIGGRRYVYLGNSNSQLRDHGIYMFHEEKYDNRGRLVVQQKTARSIRQKLGHFDRLSNIPKWLARQGQCFTQARESSNALTTSEVGMRHDYIGGSDGKEPYCFSDGVGTIAMSWAKKLSDEHALPRTATAFQIRHKGQKGLVTVDSSIDARNELLKAMGQSDTQKLVFVRPSMDKFEVEDTENGPNKSDQTNLEIVKYSSASPLYLNRPLLNILSQVSEDQSPECHKRMKHRIEQLLDVQTSNTLQSLYTESKARDVIKELTFPFAMEVFNDAAALRFTSDPFMRSMLNANARYVLSKQRSKMQIRIPGAYGRSMFGGVDRTGTLQYGQIFCQYSTSTSKHMSRTRSGRDGAVSGAIILTGPLMITKNPCVEKGDVRRFEAVDVPTLRENVDVVLFPMHGPRPHPDEMAGSDLDGDEYSLIWDQQMLFDHNEEASLFPSGEDEETWKIVKDHNGVVDVDKCETRLAEFYIEAVTQEQIGLLCNAHLATSDLYGLENKACRSLASKISQCLDFQKSGIRPEDMTRKCQSDSDEEEDRVIPPEQAERKPDYMENLRDCSYEARGIMGNIYTEIKKYQFAIDAGEGQMERIEKDRTFDLEGWQKYAALARREMDAYNYGIRTLMENYGITSEGELMSGQILSIKNRLSEKEADDTNMYNTNQVIEEKVKREVAAAREAFFKHLITWETDLSQVDNKRRDVDKDSILSRIARSSTNNMDDIRLKAAAAYNVCYDTANEQLENGETSPLLSFPWVVYDVLADIKSRPDTRIVGTIRDTTEQSNEPLAAVLSKFIDDYCQNASNISNYQLFRRGLAPNSLIGDSLIENDDLCRASYVLVRWARYIGAIQGGGEKEQFTEEHLLALFIQFGLGGVAVRGLRRTYLQPPSGEPRRHLKKGEHLLKFIEYLASREFRVLPSLSLDTMGTTLSRGQWKAFGEILIPSYLTLATSHTLDLPLDVTAETEAIRRAAFIKEFEPRKMELPQKVIDEKLGEVRDILLRVSGCVDVQLRQTNNNFSNCIVSALGTTESFKKLTALIVPPAPSRENAALREIYEEMPKRVYERLMRSAREHAE